MTDNLKVVMGMAVPFYYHFSKSLCGLGRACDESVCLVCLPNIKVSSPPPHSLGIKSYLAEEEIK